MPRIENVGEIDWKGSPTTYRRLTPPLSSAESANQLMMSDKHAFEYWASEGWYDLKLFIDLDRMPADFLENWESGFYYPSTGFYDGADMETFEPLSEDQLDLPQGLKHAFRQIAMTVGNNNPNDDACGTGVFYTWDKREHDCRIEVIISRYPDPIQYPTRYIQSLARKISSWAKEAPLK
jgi:hypothetical protein